MKKELAKEDGGNFSETMFNRVITQVALPLTSARKYICKQTQIHEAQLMQNCMLCVSEPVHRRK